MNTALNALILTSALAVNCVAFTVHGRIDAVEDDLTAVKAQANEVFYIIQGMDDIEKRIDDVEKQLAEQELENIQVFTTEEEQEDYENELIEQALLGSAHLIPNCTVTAYDICVKCCGNTNGITATGQEAMPWVTVAVDPKVIPLHSQVFIQKESGEILYCVATDTGSGVKGNHIDLCTTDHQTSLEWGVKNLSVYWIGPEG